jgi:glycosyltransferase involved in cell wall biosynthesis
MDKDLFEILVINNNSTDNTQDIAESFSEKIQNFRIILETKQGLSYARNRGWIESKGEYVAFIDDDAIADADWLSKIVFTFSSVKPKPDACGGRVELLWESPRPVWMHDSLLAPLGKFDYGTTSFFITDSHVNLSGSNMAFRKEVSEKVGFFDYTLGRQGNILLSNDETDFFQRMHNFHLIMYYTPEISVKHHVTNERLTKKWHYDRSYWQGRSSAVMDFKNNPGVMRNLVKIGIKTGKLGYYSLSSFFNRDQQKEMNCKTIEFSCKGYLFQEFQNFFK